MKTLALLCAASLPLFMSDDALGAEIKPGVVAEPLDPLAPWKDRVANLEADVASLKTSIANCASESELVATINRVSDLEAPGSTSGAPSELKRSFHDWMYKVLNKNFSADKPEDFDKHLSAYNEDVKDGTPFYNA